MILGVVQMSCVLTAVFAIFEIGLEPVTWALSIGAFASTATRHFGEANEEKTQPSPVFGLKSVSQRVHS